MLTANGVQPPSKRAKVQPQTGNDQQNATAYVAPVQGVLVSEPCWEFGMLVRSGNGRLKADIINHGRTHTVLAASRISQFTSEKTPNLLKLNLENTEPLERLSQELRVQVEYQLRNQWPAQQPNLKVTEFQVQPFFYAKNEQYKPLFSAWFHPKSKVYVQGQLSRDVVQWINLTIERPVLVKLKSIVFDPLEPVVRIYANFNLEELHLGLPSEYSNNNSTINAGELKVQDVLLTSVVNDKVTGFRTQIKSASGSWVLVSFQGHGQFPEFAVEAPSGRSSKYKIKFPVVSSQAVKNLAEFHSNIENQLLLLPEWPKHAKLKPLVRQVTDSNGFLGQAFVNTGIQFDNFKTIKFHGHKPNFVDGIPQLKGLEFVRYDILLHVIYAQNTGVAGYSCIPKEIYFAEN